MIKPIFFLLIFLQVLHSRAEDISLSCPNNSIPGAAQSTRNPSEFLVTSINQLKSRLKTSVSGDTITIQSGSYILPEDISDELGRFRLCHAGSKPITIQGQKGVLLKGPIVFNIINKGQFVLKNLNFQDTPPHTISILDGSRNRLKNLSFNESGRCTPLPKVDEDLFSNGFKLDQLVGSDYDRRYALEKGLDPRCNFNKYLRVACHCPQSIRGIVYFEGSAFGNSNRNRIDHSTFVKSLAKSVDIHSSSQYDRVDHNLFQDIDKVEAGNGREAVVVGPKAKKGDPIKQTNTLIDHNTFLRANGEGEIVCLKTGGNKVKYNLFLDSKEGHLSIRGGEKNDVFGNVFRRTWRGIRISGINHTIINNIIIEPIGEGISFIAGCIKPKKDNVNLISYDQVVKTIVKNNTVINPTVKGVYSGGWAMAVTEGNPHKTSEEECYLPPLNSEFHKNYLSSDVVNSKLFHVTDALKNQRIETIFRGDSENHLSVLANHLSWSNGSTIGEPNRYGPLDPIDSLGQYRMGSTAPTESVEKHSQLYQEVLRGTKNQNCLAVLSELSNNAIAGADFEHKNCREDLSGNGDELTDLNTFPQVLPAIPSP